MSAIIPPVRHDEVAFLGLGSNVGERLTHLQRAVDRLQADERTTVQAVSSVYQTDPVGGPEQGPYLNIAVRVATRRSPARLLRLCQEIEAALGRERRERWGPRTIDVDILLYGPRTVATRSLQIPHPRLTERAFAMVPLIEVAPGQSFPDGTALTAALARLAPIEGVTMVGSQVQAP
ncbi:MAG TPA: 2-amino-4-hydroxy-6-hydroxymethyldihydropteridine diphosphokinase [Egibacteraceae bacterium]|nr:2-amino-4-hydroxy-6-hydroxymethyldihydropteridine diphosphokinase [Egibacteraceae bacterium]